MSTRLAKPEHEVAYQDLIALFDRHKDKVTERELLAIAANAVGKMIALQDRRKVPPAMAMEIVANNIEHGNAQVLERFAQGRGGPDVDVLVRLAKEGT